VSKITLLHIDCMEYMATLPDKAFELAIVDPPYGIGVNVSMGRRKGMLHSGYHKFAGEDKSAPDTSYFEELNRVSYSQVIWGANHFIDNLPRPANASCWVIWDKMHSEDVSFAQFEMAWTSFGGVCRKFSSNVQSDRNRIHPTQKPVKLYEWLLTNYAKPGDRILDTHLGSGSSAIAAHYGGFEFVGCELDEDYYKAAVQRFESATAQLAMFGGEATP